MLGHASHVSYAVGFAGIQKLLREYTCDMQTIMMFNIYWNIFFKYSLLTFVRDNMYTITLNYKTQ